MEPRHKKLQDEGILTEISHTSDDITYQVHSKEDKTKILGTFTVTSAYAGAEPTPEIGGKFKGVHPAVVFNQTDQKALQSGGTATMAAAWAAALSKTVVRSIISADVISGIGGTAAVYVGQHGVCPGEKPLIVPIGGGAHCE